MTFLCSPAILCTAINHQRTPDALNCAFERQFTPRYPGTMPWICAYKVAVYA